SGRTPFVLGALACATSVGAKTILLTCNPTVVAGVSPAFAMDVDLVIALAVGPELLTGSTRLKAGTATKMTLNIVSTGAMVALGKVRGNLMIDLHTTNAKLRNRAVRVVADLAQCDYESGRHCRHYSHHYRDPRLCLWRSGLDDTEKRRPTRPPRDHSQGKPRLRFSADRKRNLYSRRSSSRNRRQQEELIAGF